MRRPALAVPPIQPALARHESPDVFLQSHYQHVWRTRMQDLPFVNAGLAVETIGFRQHQGDWLGVVITPWFLNLFLLYGGGSLWADLSAGQRRLVQLPCGSLQFIADHDPDIGVYQYCPLLASMNALLDMATARQAALDALQAVLTQAAPESSCRSDFSPTSQVGLKPDLQTSRRRFFRRLAGRG